MTRRKFIAGLSAAAVAGWHPARSAESGQGQAGAFETSRKIRLGLIGCGGRGRWLGELFAKHGGFEICAVADYFAERAEQVAEKFGVDKSRRFAGLNAYRRLLDCGLEAVAIVNVPYFHPDHAQAAVEAGCHVFAAKPVAVDVPGALKVQAAGRLATEKKLCFLVDYQMRTDPINIEVVRRIHAGGLGRLAHIDSVGFSPPWRERPLRTAEERLRWWHLTPSLSGDVIVENTVHSINAVLWVTGRAPARATGAARVSRSNAKMEFHDVYLVTYEFDDGLLWTHRCQSLANELDWALNAEIFGERATARVSYRGRSYLRGGPMHYGGGEVVSLYDQGAIRNVRAFHENIVRGRFENPTVQQAVEDVLTAVLGREASIRRCALTMDDLIKENKRLEFDTSGLKP